MKIKTRIESVHQPIDVRIAKKEERDKEKELVEEERDWFKQDLRRSEEYYKVMKMKGEGLRKREGEARKMGTTDNRDPSYSRRVRDDEKIRGRQEEWNVEGVKNLKEQRSGRNQEGKMTS